MEHNVFGGRSGTDAEKAYYQAFKEKYSGIANTQRGWLTECLRNKKFRIPSGLEFYFPKIRPPRTSDGWIPEESNIFNYPIQSFATADIIPIALVYMWHGMRQAALRSFIVNTVHDSVITEMHPDEEEKINEIALDAFGNRCYNYLYKVYDFKFNVPLGCGSKVGSHWGTGEEVTTTLHPPAF